MSKSKDFLIVRVDTVPEEFSPNAMEYTIKIIEKGREKTLRRRVAKEVYSQYGEQAFDVAVNYFKRHMGWKP